MSGSKWILVGLFLGLSNMPSGYAKEELEKREVEAEILALEKCEALSSVLGLSQCLYRANVLDPQFGSDLREVVLEHTMPVASAVPVFTVGQHLLLSVDTQENHLEGVDEPVLRILSVVSTMDGKWADDIELLEGLAVGSRDCQRVNRKDSIEFCRQRFRLSAPAAIPAKLIDVWFYKYLRVLNMPVLTSGKTQKILVTKAPVPFEEESVLLIGLLAK